VRVCVCVCKLAHTLLFTNRRTPGAPLDYKTSHWMLEDARKRAEGDDGGRQVLVFFFFFFRNRRRQQILLGIRAR